mmetsp:Transcript_83989/g.271443  ORF Transcript_83989/g.271443 Transcript_83989/m.271443 type:complete len:254 (-) Transcript_83989:272-1033(-)
MKAAALVLALLGVVSAVAYVAVNSGFNVKDALESAVSYIEAQGDNALFMYLLFTLVGVVALVPTTPMEFAGGFLFSARYGMWTTWALTSAAKLVANVISVCLARHIFRDFVRRTFVEKWDILRLVSIAVKEEPYKMAFLVRGSMVPLSVKNYGLGVLDIGILPIALTSCIFTPFYAYQNIYFGSACQDLKEVFAGKKSSGASGDWQSTLKTLMPMLFNACLVLFLIRAVKYQIMRSRAAVEASLKANSGTKSD